MKAKINKVDSNVKPSTIKKQEIPQIILSEPVGISSRVTDYKNDKLTNIIYDYTSSSFKKVDIYNNSIYYMQKIWIKTPIIKIFRPIYLPNEKCKNSVPLTLLLNTGVPDISLLHSFIKRMELKVSKIVKTATGNLKLKNKSSLKTIENFPPIFNINMPFTKIGDNYEFNFHIYNGSNQRINMDRLKNSVKTALYLELSNIWISETHFGYTWNVLQMKVYPEIVFKECLFDSDDEDVCDKKKNDECYHCLYCPNNHIRTMYTFVNNAPQQTHIHAPPPPPPPPAIMPVLSKPTQAAPKKPQIKAFALTIQDLQSIKLKPLKVRDEHSPNPVSDEQLKNEKLLQIREKLK
jgi:hypothetical protein